MYLFMTAADNLCSYRGRRWWCSISAGAPNISGWRCRPV